MKKYLPLLFILGISTLFRFYNFVSLFHFTMDEEYWSYIPWNIASGYHFPLIGGSMAGTGLYTGPLFVYLMAIPAWVFHGNPLGFGILVSFIGILGSVLILVLGQKMFSKKAAFLAAFLYGASFLAAIFDRHYWNASLTPFLSLLSLYFLYELIVKKRYKFFIFLALTEALAIQSHGTGMVLIMASVISLILFRVNLKNKYFLIAVGLFLFLQVPLVAFDLRHNFLNSRALFSYESKPRKTQLQSIPQNFLNFSSRLIYFPAKNLDYEQNLCPFYKKTSPVEIITVLVLGLLLIGIYQSFKEKNTAGSLSIIFILSTMLGLVFFKDKIAEYYFSPTIIPTLFLVSLALSKISKKLLIFLLGLYFYFNLYNLVTVKRVNGFDAKIEVVKNSLERVGNKTFSLEVESDDPCQIYGFRYLYTFLGREPAKSYMDGYFNWLYDKRPREKNPEYRVLMVIHENKITPVITKNSRTSN